MGIALAQPDVAWVYPLPEDPSACLEDFLERAAAHAHETAERLEHQEASVRRFLELNGEE
jgi:predicted transcriptional regulator